MNIDHIINDLAQIREFAAHAETKARELLRSSAIGGAGNGSCMLAAPHIDNPESKCGVTQGDVNMAINTMTQQPDVATRVMLAMWAELTALRDKVGRA